MHSTLFPPKDSILHVLASTSGFDNSTKMIIIKTVGVRSDKEDRCSRDGGPHAVNPVLNLAINVIIEGLLGDLFVPSILLVLDLLVAINPLKFTIIVFIELNDFLDCSVLISHVPYQHI